MRKPSEVGLSALRDARHKLSSLRCAGSSADVEKTTSHQAINTLLEANFTKAGFELDKFAALIEQDNAEARQRVANFIAEADRQAPAVLNALHVSVGALNDRLDHFETLALPDAPAQHFLLDTATEISATSGITLDSTHIGPIPENNSARFIYDASVGDIKFGHANVEQVSFGFLWQNPRRKRNAIVSIQGFIVLNGLCLVHSNGAIILSGGFSHLSIDVDLFIHELWNDPPTSPIQQSGQSQTALPDLSCDSIGAFGIGNGDNDDSQSLFRGFDLGYNQFVVPPRGTAMFEFSCSFHTFMSDGSTHSDFSSEGRQLVCPGVLIAVS